VSRVVTDLAKAFLDDGKLTQQEIDAIFKKANKKEETK
jgi:ribonuclease I